LVDLATFTSSLASDGPVPATIKLARYHHQRVVALVEDLLDRRGHALGALG
jgi:hypothetical protein